MKIDAQKTREFLAKPDKDKLAALVYGPDSGLVFEQAKAIQKSVIGEVKDAFNFAELNLHDLKESPFKLAEELTAMNMMGGVRVIWVRDAGDNTTSLIKENMDNLSPDAFLLVTAGDLPSRSSLRMLFEKEAKLACLACYQDQSKSVETMVAAYFRERGVTIDRDAVIYLAANLGNDRMITLSELEKLSVYMGDVKTVRLEDVEAIIIDNASTSLDAIFNTMLTGDAAGAFMALAKLEENDVNHVGFTRIALKQIERLLEMRLKVEQGAGIEQVVEGARPPIFFRNKPYFKKMLGMWTSAKLIRLIGVISVMESQVKLNPALAEALVSNFVLDASRTQRAS
jgi:DNA polymerase-3 subunit delta